MEIYLDISAQLRQALLALALGALCSIFYDLLRAVRRRWKVAAVGIIADFLFWLPAAAALFLLGFTEGGGQLRLFMVIGWALGAGLYFAALSRFMLPLFARLLAGLLFLLRCAAAPFVFLLGLGKKLLFLLKKLFIYLRRRYIISESNYARDFRSVMRGTGEEERLCEVKAGKYIYQDSRSGRDSVRSHIHHQPDRAGRSRKGRD